jgi:hypothetical protein
VRILLVLLLVLVAAGCVGCRIDADPFGHGSPIAERPFGWRRTALGWEKSHDWWKAEPIRPSLGARLSPVSVAAFELAVSLGGLAIFASREKKIARKTAP